MLRPRPTVYLRRSRLVALLEQGPLSRRNIIRHYPNRKEQTIDNDLNALVKAERIILRKVTLDKSKPAYVYSVPSSSPQSVQDVIDSVLDSIEHIVDPGILGKTAQFYIRRATIEVVRRGQTRFGSIPTETKRNSKGQQRLGYIELLPRPAMNGEPKKNETADFTASYTIPNRKPFRLLYQIRNRFDEVTLWDAYELAGQALRNEMQPVLIANRIGDEAKTFCEAYGIVTHTLGRQLLPAAIRAKTKRLKAYSVQALERFQFVTQQPFRLRKGRAKQIDPRSENDLAVMLRPSWIEKPRRIWVSRQSELKDLLVSITPL